MSTRTFGPEPRPSLRTKKSVLDWAREAGYLGGCALTPEHEAEAKRIAMAINLLEAYERYRAQQAKASNQISACDNQIDFSKECQRIVGA